MVGVGAGLKEWRELDSPRERDEPDPVIFLIALKSFRPTPFMLAKRTNKNEREQLDSGYVSEMKMKLLPKSCSSKYVINLAAKKWEREISWTKLEPKSNGNQSKNVWEGVWVSVWVWESSTPPLGPYLKRRWRVHQRRGKPQRLWSRWRRWGPGAVGPRSADLWGRPALGWAPWCPPLARCFLNGYKLWNSDACSEVCLKRCSNYFPKDFETQKIFLIFL